MDTALGICSLLCNTFLPNTLAAWKYLQGSKIQQGTPAACLFQTGTTFQQGILVDESLQNYIVRLPCKEVAMTFLLLGTHVRLDRQCSGQC